jgi:hypothetical protein
LNIFLGSSVLWHLWAGDAMAAFLQGVQEFTERARKLFMKAPRDPLLKLAIFFRVDCTR